MHAHAYGQKVRWKAGGRMRRWAGDKVGEIVPQPVGSTGVPPEGGVYVLWEELREPMACFLTDLELYST